jgi:hypothetical protein
VNLKFKNFIKMVLIKALGWRKEIGEAMVQKQDDAP